MRKLIKFISIILLVLFLSGIFYNHQFFADPVNAQSQEEKLQQLREEIERYQKEIVRLQGQAVTLSNQIAQYDAQINLTQLRIAETEEKISMLGGRIDRLEVSLQALTDAFTTRAAETYKMARVSEPMLFVLSASNLNTALSRFHYLQRIQESDRDLMMRLQSAQTTYQGEKEDQEVLQDQLETEKKNLDAQKAAKAHLLAETKNNEKRYQELLASARAEFEAIQAIIAGKGDEEEVGHVDKGNKIANIIQGASCNSGGTHLHFIVRSDGSTLNPFAYLNSNISYENCSGSACGSGDGDPFNPSGSWDWPISSPIKFSQGYGATWAVRNTWVGRIYSFHNGIDISSVSSSEVKAVVSGTLYRGSYSGSGGCRLRYVRVDHDDSNLDTLYLHINY